MSGWKKEGLTVKIPTYSEGWKGVWEHIRHVILGKPLLPREEIEYTISWYEEEKYVSTLEAKKK